MTGRPLRVSLKQYEQMSVTELQYQKNDGSDSRLELRGVGDGIRTNLIANNLCGIQRMQCDRSSSLSRHHRSLQTRSGGSQAVETIAARLLAFVVFLRL